VPRTALRTEPPENEFTFAKNPIAEGARGKPGQVEPLHVLKVAAAVADEVVMPHAFRFESHGAALNSNFTHQTRLHQQASHGCGNLRSRESRETHSSRATTYNNLRDLCSIKNAITA